VRTTATIKGELLLGSRAACASLALLISWLAVPVALAIEPATMTCYVKRGHCCCTSRHAFVKGSPIDSHEKFDSVGGTSAPCPERCTAPEPTRYSPRVGIQTIASRLDWTASVKHHSTSAVGGHNSPSSEPSTPRAPPRH
jgi:hypothetical protein